jgi:chemotaxis protein histidine kinase CheA/ActR/RegA family two-component response regulator
MPSAEILAVLADEVAEAGDFVGGSLARLVETTEPAAFAEAAAEYLEQVQRIAAAAAALNLCGLRSVCEFVERNLAALAPGEWARDRVILFDRWPQLVLGYLKAPRDGVYSRELAETFRRRAWPLPLDAERAQALEQALLTFDDAEDTVDAPSRETEAHAADVALEIPDDVNSKLVDAFLTEGPQQAAEYSALIQRIVRGEGWSAELNECRRLIHALKGSAHTVSVRGVATLCHHVEDILEHLAERSLLPQGWLAGLLVKVADTLETMFEALLGTAEAPTDAQLVLQSVLDVVNRIDRGEYDLESSTSAEPPAERGDRVEPPADVSAAAKPAERVEPKVRVDVRTIDDMLRVSGELTISCGHVMERVQRALRTIGELRERQSALWDRSNDMESFVATQGIAAGRRQALAAASSAAPSGFDPLEMDQYNELHTHVHGFTETVADLHLLGTRLVDALTAVETATRLHVSLNNELRDLLMVSRMVPARALESRLQRTVRQSAEQCRKEARLRLQGGDVMLDDQMVNALVDPLQHMLRNAVDHGLETPADRIEAGKPACGEIELSFARDGKYLVVRCRDDGAGLDLARIYAQALKQGVVNESQKLDESDVARLILRPGFSTAETVTQMSGRGVGMDIVHSQVVKLKGGIDISSDVGRGATFTLRLPISLGVAHCLLVAVQDETFALSSGNLEQIVYDGAHQVRASGKNWRYYDGASSCPAYFLRNLVGAAGVPEPERHVVLMNDVAGKVAVVVDAVLGGQELVLKKPGRLLGGVPGVVGASILGSGSVVPILELTELLRLERGEFVAEARSARTSESSADVLVVDDSLSVRTALSTLLAAEGFHVRTAKDGVEAIEAIRERRPGVILADLEMPRMNGLELTAHIRANAGTRDLPVIMVTSRTAEKHRKQAAAAGVDDYVTKPYREHDLVSRLRTILRKAA